MHSASDDHMGSKRSSACPVLHSPEPEEINADNMMPAPNQQPAKGQKSLLSTTRVDSTIPHAAGGGTWTYPSEQVVAVI